MRPISALLAACLCVLVSPAPGVAQVEAATDPALPEEAPYQLDAICFAAHDSPLSRLDVFVQIAYENLSFVKADDRYSASYEMMISLYDSAEHLVSEKLWTEQVRAGSFEESVSPQTFSLTQRVFEVAPGRYQIVAILRDLETRVSQKLIRQIEVVDFAHSPFALSDLMLVRRVNTVGDRKSIVPNVSPNVGNLTDGFFLFFEAYNDIAGDSIRFTATVLNEKKEKVLRQDTLFFIAKGRNQVFMKIDHSSLTLGDYSVFVGATPVTQWDSAGPSELLTTSRAFVVRWRGLPRGVGDLDLAVDQLQYIARGRELDSIKEAGTVEEKQKLFLEFWKRRDPNPNTPRNEKMEEYYGRVEYANRNFKHYIEGWRTDMGMVYIRFGPPNNVDRHPFDIDSKPYEVWSYYAMNYQFVFVDQSGFGDYRLITPLWDIWERSEE